VIPYTTADHKTYVYAQGTRHIRRIHEIIMALAGAHGLHVEDTEDLEYMLDNAVYYLWRAAFVDDHRQADAAQQRRIAWARVIGWAEPDPELERARKAVDIYDDGRTVTTTVRFGDGEDEYATHVWHPDPLHPDNRPGSVIEFSQGPYPFRFRNVIVSAPGIIDTYESCEE
jgi:hypothetical protein